MIINGKTTLKDFIFYSNIFNIGEQEVQGLFDELEKKGKPHSILKRIVPDNLNNLTLAELVTLQEARTLESTIFVSAKIILDIDREELLKAKAFDVIRFMFFVRNELEKIAKLFSDIQYKPTQEEIQAGIKNIDNGIFGTIDWYAKRMGIIDHDFASETKWIIVYQCMKIDNTSAAFEKRLREILSKKKK